MKGYDEPVCIPGAIVVVEVIRLIHVLVVMDVSYTGKYKQGC